MSSKILFIWLIAVLTLSTSSESRKGINRRTCHPNDLKGLTGFKQGIVIDTSGRLETWIGHDCCKWEGIVCDNITGRVIQLNLQAILNREPMVLSPEPTDWDMTGLLSPSITLLTSLEVIDLSEEAYLEGIIPPSIGFDLPRLTRLSLYSNRLTGLIPSSIGRLSNLVDLTLSNNMFQGPLPPEISLLRNLEYLYLSNNQLTGKIPKEFLKLTKVSELDLSGNDLEGEIPPGAPFINFPGGCYMGNRGLCGKPLDPCRS